MSRHLSEDQILAVVTGDHNEQVAVHLQSCALCRGQVEQLADLLGHFRGTMHAWSELQSRRAIHIQPRKRLWPVLACACSVAFIILLSMAGFRFSTKPSRGSVISSSSIDADALLLDHIKADVSRSTPLGMEALLGQARSKTKRR